MSNTHHVECRTTMISSPQHAQRHGTTDAEYIIHSVRGGSTKYIGLCRSVVPPSCHRKPRHDCAQHNILIGSGNETYVGPNTELKKNRFSLRDRRVGCT